MNESKHLFADTKSLLNSVERHVSCGLVLWDHSSWSYTWLWSNLNHCCYGNLDPAIAYTGNVLYNCIHLTCSYVTWTQTIGAEILSWMSSNSLQPNLTKKQFISLGTCQSLSEIDDESIALPFPEWNQPFIVRSPLHVLSAWLTTVVL